MRLRENVARNLKAVRKARGLSQEELADRAGLYRNYVGMLERREHAVTIDTLEKLADCLAIDANYLLLDEIPAAITAQLSYRSPRNSVAAHPPTAQDLCAMRDSCSSEPATPGASRSRPRPGSKAK